MTVHEYIRVIKGEQIWITINDWLGRAINVGRKEWLLEKCSDNVLNANITHVRMKANPFSQIFIEIDTEID